jgi:hypothetical protein
LFSAWNLLTRTTPTIRRGSVFEPWRDPPIKACPIKENRRLPPREMLRKQGVNASVKQSSRRRVVSHLAGIGLDLAARSLGTT